MLVPYSDYYIDGEGVNNGLGPTPYYSDPKMSQRVEGSQSLPILSVFINLIRYFTLI